MEMSELILKDLEPLYEKAEQEGLWFYCSYQQLWFSPKELRDEQKNGKFVWGVPNWQLRNPNERLTELERLRNNIDNQIYDFKSRF